MADTEFSRIIVSTQHAAGLVEALRVGASAVDGDATF
jgi:hypothetical protein